MIRKTLLLALALALCLFLSDPAWSAPPQINEIPPYGVQRGVTSEVTINGSNLAGNPRLVAPFGFRLDPPTKSVAKEDPANWKLKLVVASDAAIALSDPGPDRRRDFQPVPIRGRATAPDPRKRGQ